MRMLRRTGVVARGAREGCFERQGKAHAVQVWVACARRHSKRRDCFHEEEGFSTIGMVLALLITLSLIFSAAQVYQLESISAEVQNVADVAALSAENAVAEFYIAVRLCDALVLSLSLTSAVVLGLSVVVLCTPVTAPLSKGLIDVGGKIIKARNSFAEKAAEGLNRVQAALPFISAVKAASVIADNSGGATGSEYFGFAILLPFKGEPIEVGVDDAAQGLLDDIKSHEDEMREAAAQAEEAARRAKQAKETAFMHDCGLTPAYCMYERADTLAYLSPSDNPLYHSVDAWSFGVAMKRAQSYYPARLQQEAPEDDSADSQTRSALRKNFYRYATREIEQGYVHEDGVGTFDAYFPHMPKNTAEMRNTDLYTEAVYPFATGAEEGGLTMHAWPGCAGLSGSGALSLGSIEQMEGGGFTPCSVCEFSAASLGKVAAASTSIDSGFEYHYEKVAENAEAYQKAREEGKPVTDKVKSLVDTLLSGLSEVLHSAASYRIEAHPPGKFGAVAFACSTTQVLPADSLLTSFVKTDAVLGVRAAVSAATLVSDASEEGKNVIASLLDGICGEASNNALGPLEVVLDLWSSILFAYTQGGEAVSQGIEGALSGIPLAGESGLGTWAARQLESIVEAVGLKPVDLDAPKPALVNTAHVLGVDDSSFSKRFLEAKAQCVSAGDNLSGDFFSLIVSQIEDEALAGVEGLGDTITLATLDPFGSEGPSIPITIALPPAVKSAAADAVQSIAESIRAIHEEVVGVRRWE